MHEIELCSSISFAPRRIFYIQSHYLAQILLNLREIHLNKCEPYGVSL